MNSVLQLRHIRSEVDGRQDPATIVKLARPLIKTGTISVAGDESWDIYEQTLIAALEVSDDSLALECLTRLSDKFPDSGRVHALRGMMLECTQDPQEAIRFYEKVLAAEPTNVPVIKRQITFAASSGRTVEAIELLTRYLSFYYSDADAWSLLGELYISVNAVDKATFSLAEVVLLKPYDHIQHANYADSLFLQALEKNDDTGLQLALRHYLRSVELCDDYARGLCGVKVCCNSILSSDRRVAKDSKTRMTNQQSVSSDSLSEDQIKSLNLTCLRSLIRIQKNMTVNWQDKRVSEFITKLIATTPSASK